MNMAKRNRISALKAIEKVLRSVDDSDCESDNENDEDLGNYDLSLLNENEDNFIYEKVKINLNGKMSWRKKMKEDLKDIAKQWTAKHLVNSIKTALDIGNYNLLALLENTTSKLAIA